MRKKAMQNIVIVTSKEKQELATQKVNLSKMDDVQDAISTAYVMKDAFEEAYDDAQVLVIKASDIIRFDWSDAITEAEGYMDELESAIKELGVDMPNELKQFRKEIDELESDRKVADGKLDGIGK